MKVFMIKKQVRTVNKQDENPLNPPKPLKNIKNNIKKLNFNIGKLSISKKQNIKKLKEESSNNESSDDDSSDDDSSDDESSDNQSSNNQSSDNQSSDDNTKKVIVNVQTKRKLEETIDKTFEKQCQKIITKTKDLIISLPIEKQNSLKKVKLNVDSLKNKWENLSVEYPIINKELHIVNEVKTKYVSFINYNFTGKPTCCKYWNSQFYKNFEENIFEKHRDLLPVFFIFSNYNDFTYTSKMINYKETIIFQEDDIKIQINQFLTLILRPVSNKVAILANKEIQENSIYFKNRVIYNLRFATHSSKQINIYNNQNILDPFKSWALHLILNENKLSINGDNTNILFINDKKEFIYPLVTLYQSLYLYFSDKINI